MMKPAIITQKFHLRPKQRPGMASLKSLPLDLQQLVHHVHERCSSDLELYLTFLKPYDPSALEWVTQNGLTSSSLESIDHKDLEQTYYHIQDTAKQFLFQEIYPKQFLKIHSIMREEFEQLSRQHPEKFKETSRSAIQALLLDPPFKYLKVDPSFVVAKQIVMFRPEIIEAVIINLYMAYRTKIIRDASLQLIAKYLADPTIASQKVLVQFFQEVEPPVTLTEKLFENLKEDVERTFPGWEECQPGWSEYLKTLRQVRNMACKALDDEVLYTSFQEYLRPLAKQLYYNTIVESFTIKAHKNKKTLQEYLVELLMHKLQAPLRGLFDEIWNKNFLQEQEIGSLRGVKQFIYEFMQDFVKTIPDYSNRSAGQMWQALKDPKTKQNRLISHLEKTRPMFQDLITKVDFHQLAHQGLETWIQTTYQKTGIDGKQITIPNKHQVFRTVHKATPLQNFTVPPDRPIRESIQPLKECLEEFLITRFQRRAEEIVRKDLITKLVPKLVEVLQDPRNFVNKQPEFVKTGLKIVSNTSISELDVHKKEFKLTMTFLHAIFSPNANWFSFTFEDPEMRSERRKDVKMRDLSAITEDDWRPKSYLLSYHKHTLHLTVQYEKEAIKLPKLSIGKKKVTRNEIVIGVKLGLDIYATVSVMLAQSSYWRTSTGKIRRKVLPENIEEYDRLFIRTSDIQPMKLDLKSETTQIISPKADEKPCPRASQKSDKEVLCALLVEQRKALAQVHNYISKFPSDYGTRSRYIHAEQLLSALDFKISKTTNHIALSVAIQISALVKYYATKYPNQRVRVQIEDLQRSKTPLSVQHFQASHFVRQHQVLDFYYQIHYYLVSLLWEDNIGVWRVDPVQCSQLCALCGHPGQSQNKLFRCTNNSHNGSQSDFYTCDARLNIARNIALFPPLGAKPLPIGFYL
ncbi:MAG: hypothetical protein ACFFC7_00135 [Candidatus Hermodarchaeota archaeon]